VLSLRPGHVRDQRDHPGAGATRSSIACAHERVVERHHDGGLALVFSDRNWRGQALGLEHVHFQRAAPSRGGRPSTTPFSMTCSRSTSDEAVVARGQHETHTVRSCVRASRAAAGSGR
jgi:hypothetical protein